MSNTQYKNDVKKIYNSGASKYRDIYLNPKSLYDYEKLRRMDIVFKYICEQKARNILDLGCGPGYVSSLLSAKLPNSKIIGIDFSKNMIDSAKLIKRQNTQFFECDAEGTPFDDNEFDVIYALGVFEKFQNLENVIKESHRILKPGGKLYFTYPNYFSFLHKFRRFIMYLRLNRNLDQDFQKFSLSKIKNLLSSGCFEVEIINFITYGNSIVSLPWTNTLNKLLESFFINNKVGEITSLSSLWVVKKNDI